MTLNNKQNIYMTEVGDNTDEDLFERDVNGSVTLAELPALQQLVRRLQLGLVLDGSLGKQIRIEEIVTVIPQEHEDCRKRFDRECHTCKAYETTKDLESVNKEALERVEHLETELELRNVRVKQLEDGLDKSVDQMNTMKSMFAARVKSNGETESQLEDVRLDLAWCQDRLRRAEVEISFMKQVHGVRGTGSVLGHQIEKSGSRARQGNHCDKQPSGLQNSPSSDLSREGNGRNLGPGLLGPVPLIPRPLLLAGSERSR